MLRSIMTLKLIKAMQNQERQTKKQLIMYVELNFAEFQIKGETYLLNHILTLLLISKRKILYTDSDTDSFLYSHYSRKVLQLRAAGLCSDFVVHCRCMWAAVPA